MIGNEDNHKDNKSRALAFLEKALGDLKKDNYPLAEFYLLAAVKEDPENPEYQTKLEEVRKILAQNKEKEAAQTPRTCEPALSGQLNSASAPRPGPKKSSPKEKGFKLFGIRVKKMSPRAIYSILGVLLGLAVVYSVYASLTKQNAHVDISDINKTYGIALESSSQGGGELHGIVVGEAWRAMPTEEKEKKIRQIFQDYKRIKGIKILIFWDERFSEVARASESGIKISQ
ncbi:MAG: hypothetical protein NT056_07965 [Proteobacteria bacterium]|nr:hypothetical protein [Pseudomonadota bacterium]